MNDLKTVSALVKQILKDDVDARNSDNVLYLEILRYYSSEKGIDLYHLVLYKSSIYRPLSSGMLQ